MNLEKFHQVLELFELQANMSRSQRQLTRLVWNPVFPFTVHRVRGIEQWEHSVLSEIETYSGDDRSG